MTTAVTAATTTASPSLTKTSQTTAPSSDFETFLKMLTVQMQNQDPLNPIDSTDYAVQLATFSNVEQAVLTNGLLEGLSSQLGLLGFSQLSGWVGMEARSTAPAYFDGTPVSLIPTIASGADNLRLIVRDSSGDIVQTLKIEPTEETIDWAGVDANSTPLTNGLYSFEIENYNGEEFLSTTPVETYSRINEARAVGGRTVLILEGGYEIASDDVTALRETD